MAYARQHSPFYRAHWAGHDPQDWRALPTVDKQLMMAHFDQFNTRMPRFGFADSEVLATLRDLAARPVPLVTMTGDEPKTRSPTRGC